MKTKDGAQRLFDKLNGRTVKGLKVQTQFRIKEKKAGKKGNDKPTYKVPYTKLGNDWGRLLARENKKKAEAWKARKNKKKLKKKARKEAKLKLEWRKANKLTNRTDPKKIKKHYFIGKRHRMSKNIKK